MTKRSVALVGVLIVMAMIGSSVIGAVSAIAASETANGSFSVFLPLILNAIGAMAEVPQGAVLSFNLPACPSGWTEVTDAQGRAIVGLPPGGTLTGTVGSAITDLEDRSHTHDVNPAVTNSSNAGGHTHTADPPVTMTTSDGSHQHVIDPPNTVTSNYEHNHPWAFFTHNEQYFFWNSGGGVDMVVDWDDGIGDAGSGYFPLAGTTTTSGQIIYFTAKDTHDHNLNITSFNSQQAGDHNHILSMGQFTTGSSGSHFHAVDISNTSSTTASTSDVMPYIQFLVCEKD